MNELGPTKLPRVERGTGDPVVFVHGYPLSHAMWEPQLRTLSDHHRVVLLDLPGYGLARAHPVPTTLGGFSDTVHRTLVQLFPGPVVIVGHSFGGYVALDLLRDHPEHFAGLVLADTRSEPDTPEAREKRMSTVRHLRESGQGLDVEATVRSLLAPGTWESEGHVVNTVREIVQEAPPESAAATLIAIADRPDLTPVLPTIRVPTLVLWGEEDALIPPSQSRSMVGRIPGAVGEGIALAAHLPSLEAPDSFARSLEGFLARRPAP